MIIHAMLFWCVCVCQAYSILLDGKVSKVSKMKNAIQSIAKKVARCKMAIASPRWALEVVQADVKHDLGRLAFLSRSHDGHADERFGRLFRRRRGIGLCPFP